MSRLKLGPITAYAIAVKHGFEGTEEEWLASLKGEKGENGVTVDTELSETSENPLQNKVITKALNEKVDKVIEETEAVKYKAETALITAEQAEQNAKAYTDQKFNGANKAVSFINYSSMITSLNGLENNAYSVSQNIMIVTLAVPDLWVSEIVEQSVAYTYISDTDFVNELTTNGSVQVGHYRLSALETQKVDLTDYVKNTDIADNLKPGLVAGGKNYYGFVVGGGSAIPRTEKWTLEEYNNKLNDYYFMGKGTLENIKNDYVKRALVENDITLTDEEKALALAWLGAVGQTELENKVDKVSSKTTYSQIYIKQPSGEQNMVNISHLNKGSGFIPSYAPASSTAVGATDNGGTFAVAMPQQPYQPAPKKYVDDAIANAGGGGTKLYAHELKTRYELNAEQYWSETVTIITTSDTPITYDTAENGIQIPNDTYVIGCYYVDRVSFLCRTPDLAKGIYDSVVYTTVSGISPSTSLKVIFMYGADPYAQFFDTPTEL